MRYKVDWSKLDDEKIVEIPEGSIPLKIIREEDVCGRITQYVEILVPIKGE